MNSERDFWPSTGLQYLSSCPVCGSAQRVILHAGLQDSLYCAPGKWDMHACQNCGSGYLNPRPSAETIGIAYGDYHTHQEPSPAPAAELPGFRRFRRALANGYKNWRFGTALQPSSKIGIAAAFLLPIQRSILDRQYRHLPGRVQPGRVLDIGFGDGGFLENALSAGWSVVGTDSDPTVVQQARLRGLDVRLGTIDGVSGPFDVITMSHVLEHLHDPVSVLRNCYELLRPGGTLWVETPNIDAIGHRRFGAGWRALEPPRHLVLFNRKSLERAMLGAGFTEVRDLPQPSPIYGMYSMSRAISEASDPTASAGVGLSMRLEMSVVRLLEWMMKSRREFLAVTARKPSEI